jgi:hypothetical protein
MPPVCSNPGCVSRSTSGSVRRMDSLTMRSLRMLRSPSVAVTASMDALPQTPQLDEV